MALSTYSRSVHGWHAQVIKGAARRGGREGGGNEGVVQVAGRSTLDPHLVPAEAHMCVA